MSFDTHMDTDMTDFSTWDRETLERFAREAADENKQLREDVKMLLNRIRELLKK